MESLLTRSFMIAALMLAVILPLSVPASAGGEPDEDARANQAAPASAAKPTPRPARPNVVVIIIDTLRADPLGCYGHPGSPSPELDAIAAEGVRFERAIAPSSWTRPSIGAMVTGSYPRTLGLYDERNERLPAAAATLSELFHAAGYTTIGATANPNINTVFGFGQGFDRYLDSNRVFDWMKRRPGERVARRRGLVPAAEIFGPALKLTRDPERAPYSA